MIAAPLTRPCTILRHTDSGTVNDYGDPIAGDPDETVTVCELQQRQRDEGDQQGELSDTHWNLYLPAGVVIGTADTVLVDGQAYELVGDPWPAWDRVVQRVDHVEATVRRTA